MSLWEIIRFIHSHECGASMKWGGCHDGLMSLKERHQRACFLSLFTTLQPTKTQEQIMWTHSKVAATYRKKKKNTPQKSSHAGTLTLDFAVSRAVRNLFLLLKPPNWWYFVMTPKLINIVLNYIFDKAYNSIFWRLIFFHKVKITI